ncbi:hypothetical protein PF005_g18009 [Phytophthora fragariae]|uniref:Uncharacterized protein n=2 Tax=Phytophthora TaxID=4783 RepID=A0A6A3JK22_9STRA|nr:hypothetical protein PF003_g28404 [Phytophthora fragariae]KAE9003836.1 hypothetical protein PR002_g17224 [Phytophthora rubi]KAE8932531.1 hypothetical protein PF009_g17439 [Phytophthora fragariae]KAE8992033.1 hypothetical protein PF011_g17698 [Phytophthora fragariae]KAE9091330.1 hypothetical protein PF010_g18226 [Phytophthora fragariae]
MALYTGTVSCRRRSSASGSCSVLLLLSITARSFSQSAKARYYSAKREGSEHVCDYLNQV